MNGMIYLTTGARLLADANGGDYAAWLDLLDQAVQARELPVLRVYVASMLPGGVSFVPRSGEARTPVAGFIRWCEQRGYGLAVRTQGKAKTGPREAQVRQIETAARTLGYGDCLTTIPYGGKARIRDACSDLSDDAFTRAWRVADEQGRLRVANKERFKP